VDADTRPVEELTGEPVTLADGEPAAAREQDGEPGALAGWDGEPGQHSEPGALFVAARDGDRVAFAELVRQLTPLLWQVARSQRLDRDSSVDAVQTGWLELLGAMDAIREPNAVVGWLVTVVRREAWRLRRTGGTEVLEPEPLLTEVANGEPGPEDQVIERDRRARLWAAVDALPERCRTLLRIVAFVQRPEYSVVSKALGMPVGSIGPNRGRCLDRLRRLLLSDPKGGWR
jgi:RNA polymerase sigma factor (sigma-70 family)